MLPFWYPHPSYPDLHSFPTRRSSDLRSRRSGVRLHRKTLVPGGPVGSQAGERRGVPGWTVSFSHTRFRLLLSCLPADGKRSEEHTSELQSHHDLVCRLLLEKHKQAC